VIFRYLANFFPALPSQLRVAHILMSPDAFIKKVFIKNLMATVLVAVLFAMLTDRMEWSWFVWVVGVIVIWFFGFWFGLKQPLIIAHRRAIDIDREVLFAGRFILIKLHSGRPLVSALTEAAHSYGVANKYFSEIIKDIEVGTSLEDAIERAMNNSPSMAFRKILFQIHNALRLGIDVTQSLEAVLEDITEDQLLQIQRYGKKLPSVTLLFMVVAVVFPSLGMTIATILLTFTNITMTLTSYLLVILFLIILNFMFITMFKGIRPKVNI